MDTHGEREKVTQKLACESPFPDRDGQPSLNQTLGCRLFGWCYNRFLVFIAQDHVFEAKQLTQRPGLEPAAARRVGRAPLGNARDTSSALICTQSPALAP